MANSAGIDSGRVPLVRQQHTDLPSPITLTKKWQRRSGPSKLLLIFFSFAARVKVIITGIFYYVYNNLASWLGLMDMIIVLILCHNCTTFIRQLKRTGTSGEEVVGSVE